MTTLRRPGAASAAVLMGLTFSLGAAHVLAPDWSRRAGLDVWNLPAVEEQFRRSCREEAEVEAQGEQAAARRAVANHVATELINGGALATATDELMELLGGDPAFLTTFETLYPEAPTLRHRFALHAIDRADRLLQGDPLRRAALKARLRAEYHTLDASPEARRVR